MRLKQIVSVLTALVIGVGLCPFSLAEGRDSIVPPPLTEWPSDPGPKPERPIYPAIQAWVIALEETTSWTYSDWVQPSWLEDLFVVFQDGENNLLLWFVKMEDGAWQLKTHRENTLPKTAFKITLCDLATGSDYFDDTPSGIGFSSGYWWSLWDIHSMSDYTCLWRKQPDGSWHLTQYSEWFYQEGDDRNEVHPDGIYIRFHEDFVSYYTDYEYLETMGSQGKSVSIQLDTNLETVVVDDIPKTAEAARQLKRERQER